MKPRKSIYARAVLVFGIVFVILFYNPSSLQAQWTGTSDIYYNGGNVGIGTSEPAQKLHVVGNILLGSSGNWYGINKASGEARAVLFNGALLSDSDYLYFGSLNNGFKFVDASNSVLMTIKNNGNVGIGTTSPGVSLDISQPTAIVRVTSSAGTNRSFIQLANGTTNFNVGAENEAGNGVVTTGGLPYAGMVDVASARPLQFATSDTVRMTIDSSGSVGIGTTSPRARFDVYGLSNEAWFGSEANGPQQLVIGNTRRQNYGDVMLGKNLGGTSGSDSYKTLYSASASTYGYSGLEQRYGGDIYFYGSDSATTANSTVTPTARMAIQGSTGNVGIGTTSPRGTLDVGGGGSVANSLVFGFSSSELPPLRLAQTRTQNYADGFIGKNISGVANASSDNYVTPQTTSGGGYSGTEFRYGGDVVFYAANGATTANGTVTPVARLFVQGSTGNVGIGKTNPTVALDVVGSVNLTGTINAKYQDVAEWVPASEQLSPGTVVVLDSTKSNQVTSSSVSYDTRVAGVISEQPGIALGEKSEGKVLVATTGRVRVKVDASKGPIRIGDLLVTSDVPGMAMKSEPITIGGRQIHSPGTLIGKALEPLEKGRDQILVLLSLQ